MGVPPCVPWRGTEAEEPGHPEADLRDNCQSASLVPFTERHGPAGGGVGDVGVTLHSTRRLLDMRGGGRTARYVTLTCDCAPTLL